MNEDVTKSNKHDQTNISIKNIQHSEISDMIFSLILFIV